MEQQEGKRGRGRPRKTVGEHSRIKTITITSAQKAALTAYSLATGRTISQLVSGWIEEVLDEDSDV